MCKFDVKREVDNLCREFGWDPEVAPGLRIVLRRCRDAAVRETEEELILEGCPWCRDYGPPQYRPAGPVWMHPAGQTPIQGGGGGGDACIECRVPAIHERHRLKGG